MRRLRYITLAIILLIALACGGSAPTAASPTINNNAATDTVMLVSADQYHVYCGAVRVGPRLLVTANHCVDDVVFGGPVYYVTHDGYQWGWERHAAALVARDEIQDVALLRATQSFASYASVRFEDIEPGEPVCGMHHSWGVPYAFACGIVVRADNPAPDVREYVASIQVRPGASGSGLWDRHGQLAGVTLRYRRITGWGIYVSIGPVVDLIQETGM